MPRNRDGKRRAHRKKARAGYAEEYEIGALGVAATGEAALRHVYGEGGLGLPTEGTISGSDAVREGSTG